MGNLRLLACFSLCFMKFVLRLVFVVLQVLLIVHVIAVKLLCDFWSLVSFFSFFAPLSVCFQAVFIETSLGHQGSEVRRVKGLGWR